MKIELNNISKSYDDKLILKDLNINISNITSLGIIGESGCGKSTLLRQLSGIEIADEGTIIVNNIKLVQNSLKEYHDKIGYVFQKHNLFPHLSIKNNILLILERIKKMDKSQANKKCDEVLEEFYLIDIAKQKPNKVSGGQAQRASIARAFVTSPELVFLDEPTAALDPILTKEVLDSVQILKNKGTEFIFVTHEMEFLKKFADYFIFMDKGEIIEHGYMSYLDNPKTQKLRKFMNR
ncbi:amino acid ABC transporter ATP-binding protein [Clostridium sediminicola]|uniref:amino acid ABC transporter ATP-binding protein n=1 Tax=Clostridium sediminicola TaxID=3114879 RepID=UPI0031F22576